MDNTITLRKDDNNQTVVVQTENREIVTPLSQEEIIRQIKEHSAIINSLQLTLQAVQQFEASKESETTSPLPKSIDQPVISQKMLESMEVQSNDETSELKGE